MGGIVEKLARGTARLAFWRKPDEASPDTAAPAAASASNTAPTADAPKPSWFAHLKQKLQRGEESAAAAPEPSAASVSNTAPTADAPKPSWFARLKQKLRRSAESAAPASVAVPVQAVITTPAPPPVEAPPPPPSLLVPQQLEEMLELSDPVAPPAHADMLFGGDTPEAEIQALDTPVVADSLAAEMGSPELEPESVETADIAQADRAQDPLAELPQAKATPKNSAATAPPSAEATLEEGDEPDKPQLLSRLLGTLSKKWVWIPSVSVAMLAVMGTLSFMLIQSKQATHELQAELANAKKQLKQVPVKPQVVPPLLVAHKDVTPHGVNAAAASPNDAPYDEASPQAAADSSPSLNMDMDCDISDKASVAKNLRNCIEAYNQATAR
ncbi:MAG: hypothetical protein Q8K52_00990 [Thiobacillus sp.]|nr:hypothetical protein [Thiobacillus sp.]